jgi:DNA adenine methylase
MKITRLVPWFGANAAHADVPAKMLTGCKWVYIPFAGSMTEVPHFPPTTQVMLSDVHDELICLARIVADPKKRLELAAWLDAKLFHPAELDEAREVLARARAGGDSWLFGDGGQGRPTPEECAEAYFTLAWMGRSGVAGTDGEERVKLALRYDAGGGDPVVRYRSAVESLEAWHQVLRRCSITREPCWDVFERLRQQAGKCGTQAIGLYCDPPWPDDGDGYLHTFTDADQRRLARELAEMPAHVRIVMRWGDHPLIRELYPENVWEWTSAEGRTAVGAKAEVFLKKR